MDDFNHVEGVVINVLQVSVQKIFSVPFGRNGIVVIIDVQQPSGQADKEVAGRFSGPGTLLVSGDLAPEDHMRMIQQPEGLGDKIEADGKVHIHGDHPVMGSHPDPLPEGPSHAL